MSDLRKAYKDAGVNVEEGYRAVELMASHVKSTHNHRVIDSRAGFGGLFDLSQISEYNIDEPVLVSGTDGVGTKLKLAFDTGIFDTVGIDLVAMCVNDIICSGARPLYFLDYIGTGKLKAEQAEQIVKGIATGCRQASCALIGGETAEMPGFYPDGEFDLAGFAVGVVDKKKIIDGSKLKSGDLIIGLPSSGPHSNGYSLIRSIVYDKKKIALDEVYDGSSLDKKTVGEVLLTPTKIYVNEVMSLLDRVDIKAMAHITGGGFNENVARILPDDLNAVLDKDAWTSPEIFSSLAEWGGVDSKTMHAVFNMGIGFVLVLGEEEAKTALDLLGEVGSDARIIGEIQSGSKQVIL